MPVRDTASAQPFLSPTERRLHAKEVNAIVKLAAEGKYPEALWPVAASVGFGPQDLKRLPVDVAAGVAEIQQKLATGPAPVGRNLAALIEVCGIEALLHEDSRDLLECLEKASARAAMLSLARNMRCNEGAAGEQLSHASANVTAVEAQRSGNTAARLISCTLQLKQSRQKLDIEAGKAERDGILQPEARGDEARRGRRIRERVGTDRAREKHQRQRDEHELAMALEAAAEEAAKRHAANAASGAEEAGYGQNDQSSPCKAGVTLELGLVAGGDQSMAAVGEYEQSAAACLDDPEAPDGPNEHSTPCTVSATGAPSSLAARPARRGRRAMAAARTAALAAERAAASTASAGMQAPARSTDAIEQGQDVQRTPCTVSDSASDAPAPSPWGAGIPARESAPPSLQMLPVADAADAYATSATTEPLIPAAMLPLPLADRRAAASDALRELQSPAAKDDPANGWEVEMLGIAVKTGRASASIVARFVEEAGAVEIFPEPGSTAGRRPSFPEFLGRLAPRGSPRVTATASSSVSLVV